MVDYDRINTVVRAAVMSKPKGIMICPFGEEGMMAKQVLNQRYGIMEKYVLDNRLAQVNPSIKSVDELSAQDVCGYAALLMNSNREINQVLEKQLGKYCTRIYNILRPVIMEVPEKRDYFVRLKKLLCAERLLKNPLVRMGKPYDGGYVLVDDFSDEMRVYSFGIAHDVSFEKDCANRGMRVFLYDHTIEGLPEMHENFRFFRTGISCVNEPENNKLSLLELLQRNGDMGNQNLILKMDVEGAEWGVIMETPAEIWKQFRQISFEFHRITDINNPLVVPALERLNETHQIVWLHPNNYGHIERSEKGMEIPAYVELTYVNRDVYKTEPGECCFPLAIDLPDDPKIEEFVMGDWGNGSKAMGYPKLVAEQ